MSAWAKANKVKNDDIMFLSDVETKFSKSIGWTVGDRTARYAMIMDHGKVVYAERETKPGDVTVSLGFKQYGGRELMQGFCRSLERRL